MNDLTSAPHPKVHFNAAAPPPPLSAKENRTSWNTFVAPSGKEVAGCKAKQPQNNGRVNKVLLSVSQKCVKGGWFFPPGKFHPENTTHFNSSKEQKLQV